MKLAERADWFVALLRSDVSDSAVRVGGEMFACMNSSTGRLNPSIPTMAANLGKSARTVDRSLRELKLKGWIDSTGKGGRSRANSYLLTIPGPKTTTDMSGNDGPETPSNLTGFEAETTTDLTINHDRSDHKPRQICRAQGTQEGTQEGTQKDRSPQPAARASEKGRRWGDEEVVPNEWLAWAVETEGFARSDAERQADRFADYWRGATGRNATKRDWPATWRNWIRRARDDGRPTHAGTNGSRPRSAVERVEQVNRERAAARDRARGAVDPDGEDVRPPLDGEFRRLR